MLSPTEATTVLENIRYLPHHAVTNPNKPKKVRVVFDAAASYKRTSLNDQLVAMITDLETMFFSRYELSRKINNH